MRFASLVFNIWAAFLLASDLTVIAKRNNNVIDVGWEFYFEFRIMVLGFCDSRS
ncbi:MAG: hypothetical protein LBJ00_04360 [Planctomycetaceae bacterium]|jgi:hypothetical protein|nr:hypothetical protein [Planctomycetaceae bacterium]